jgi:L-asparaginase
MQSKLTKLIFSAAATLLFSITASGQSELPRVHILATGGTIASTDSGLLNIDELASAVPGLDELAVLSAEDFISIGSSRITPEIQFQLAQRINELFVDDELAGVVVTHGTDSLEETAFFIDLLVADSRPVVFTAAQRSPRRTDTDGPRNLTNAVLIAGSNLSRDRGVSITLNDDIHSARYARKTHSTAVEAFQSVGAGRMGYVDEGRLYYLWQPDSQLQLSPSTIEARVDLIRLVAGSDGHMVRASIAAGAKGIILEVFGRGNVPPPVTEALNEAAAAGMAIVFTTRTGGGRVTLYSEFDELPIINGEDIDGLKARMLLIAALGQTSDAEVMQSYFTTLSGYQ